jgi:S-adenosylmethionine:tRNA ribosyltransferase-isomerase
MDDVFLDYELPPHLIAQVPAAERDQCRLLVIDRQSGTIHHHVFTDLPGLLRPGDLLILNNTRVVPARLYGCRVKTGGKWEGLFLREADDGAWDLLSQTRGFLRAGEEIQVEAGELRLQVIAHIGPGEWRMKPLLPGSAFELLERFGHMPLPPYIGGGKDAPPDKERYQTLFADQPGAVAAPTAGLHFTPRVFAELRKRAIETAFVTLHVGLGTFQPIKTSDFRAHVMHRETAVLSLETAQAIAACKKRGGRVVAVGTTSVRVLESRRLESGTAWSGDTDLFIYPPYDFQDVDAMVTNFHLPRTSLLLLVQAFAGVALTRRAYLEAIERAYRFYSYGDAMLIL